MDNFKKTCWEMFSKTGDISYYMLYHALDEVEKEDERS